MEIHREEYKEKTIVIYQDENPSNPREEFCNFGRMICFHKRYNLGDNKIESYEQDASDFQRFIKRGQNVVCLPLYLFDHSGLTISVDKGMFVAVDSYGWDWGLLGWIYVTKEMIRNEFKVRRVTKKLIDDVKKVLVNEVEIYDQFLRGEVYGYEVFGKDKENQLETYSNFEDSCWGFFGDISYPIQEAKEYIDRTETLKEINGEG